MTKVLGRAHDRLHDLAPLRSILSAFVWRLGLLAALGVLVSLLDGVVLSFVIVLLAIAVGGAADMGNGIVGWLFEAIYAATAGSVPTIALIILATILTRVLLATSNDVFSSTAKYEIYHELRLAVFDKYLHEPYSEFMVEDRGVLFNTMEMETWNVAEAVQCAFRIVANIGPVLVFGGLVLLTDWAVGLTVCIGGVLVLGALRHVRRPVRKLGMLAQRHNERLGERAYTAMVGMRTIRLHGYERAAYEQLAEASNGSLKSFRRLVRASSLAGPPMELLFVAVVGLALGIGALLHAPSATLILIIALLFRLQPYLMRVQSDLARLFSLEYAMHTVAEVLGRPDVRENGGAPFSFTREIRFSRVAFKHVGAEEPTLSGLSAVLPKGELIAVLGPSGAGKSTLANLLLGLLSPSTGDVFVDDVPLRDIDRTAWLSRVSLAGQDADLLEGTLEENIKMGHSGAGEHDVQWALAVTGASEFVATLPEGLHTRVGDRGMRFSGGQRQRLTLARAIVGRPAVLVLDEATNAIQADVEAIVLDRLRAALPDATILVIAHRSEAVGIADTILRVANGRVIEGREATASERSISPPALHAVVRE